MPVSKYVGRFAPSPTGPLHFGSIITALGSFLDAHSQKGIWLLRIDDIDTARVRTGACDAIMRALEALGLHWDGDVVFQGQRLAAYQTALAELRSRNMLYACVCPRRILKGKPYPGTCRDLTATPKQRHSYRIKTYHESISLHDRLQGQLSLSLQKEWGDFIVHRADGLIAYHLAVVIDDSWQGVNHIVRGMDLFHSTTCQVYLQKIFGVDTPSYCHLPVAVDHSGKKISKQNHAKDALLHEKPASILIKALTFLGQQPDTGLQQASVNEVLDWAKQNWDLSKVPKRQEIPVSL